jgi:hypothetical protein
MNIDEAFSQIADRLRAGSDSGVKPSIRTSGNDWVCTLEDQDTKFNIIAKEGELMIVDMESKGASPRVDRISAPGVTQQELIQRIQNAIEQVCGE